VGGFKFPENLKNEHFRSVVSDSILLLKKPHHLHIKNIKHNVGKNILNIPPTMFLRHSWPDKQIFAMNMIKTMIE